MTSMTSTANLQVENIHKSYGSHEVLKGVSLLAHRGDVISIIGSSGSGKSTFLRCINFLEKPSSGTISVKGPKGTLDRVIPGTITVRQEGAELMRRMLFRLLKSSGKSTSLIRMVKTTMDQP